MRRAWTEEEIALLRRTYADTPTAELAEQLGHPVHAVYQKAYDLKLCKSAAYLAGPHAARLQRNDRRGEPTWFTPGHVPWNKGLSGYKAGGRSPETRFRPGNRPHTWVPIGSERVTDEGYRQRKVSDTGYAPRDWVGVHVLVYRAHHGEVPPGHCVIFIDGDKTHLDPANLTAVSRQELAYLNGRGYARLPAPLRPSAIALARLACKKQQRRRA